MRRSKLLVYISIFLFSCIGVAQAAIYRMVFWESNGEPTSPTCLIS